MAKAKEPLRLKIEYVPIGSIKPYARNPRDNAAAVPGVAASLREFGWRQPIVIDAERVIVVGDTRYRAAIRNGDEVVPIVFASDLSPAQIAAYRIADNRTNQDSGWDRDLVTLELRELRDAGEIAPEATGFNAAELTSFLTPVNDGGAQTVAFTARPKRLECPSCGHIWTTGR